MAKKNAADLPSILGAPGTVQGVALLLWSAGLQHPERLATPFVMAQAAVALEQSVELYFSAQSVHLLTQAAANQRVGFGPERLPLADYLRQVHGLGAKFFACSQALRAAGLTRADLAAECDGLGGAVQFMARCVQPRWRGLVF